MKKKLGAIPRIHIFLRGVVLNQYLFIVGYIHLIPITWIKWHRIIYISANILFK